jgi:hypothetical protein
MPLGVRDQITEDAEDRASRLSSGAPHDIDQVGDVGLELGADVGQRVELAGQVVVCRELSLWQRSPRSRRRRSGPNRPWVSDTTNPTIPAPAPRPAPGRQCR